MNGGKGYSWFKVILVDEAKQYAQLDGYMQGNYELIGELSPISTLIGRFIEQQLEGEIEGQHLIGVLRNQHLIGVLGGENDE